MSILADKEKMMARFKICNLCKFLKRGLVNRCADCGCPIKSKVMLNASKCTKGKW